jgi:hypothetical protein
VIYQSSPTLHSLHIRTVWILHMMIVSSACGMLVNTKQV